MWTRKIFLIPPDTENRFNDDNETSIVISIVFCFVQNFLKKFSLFTWKHDIQNPLYNPLTPSVCEIFL